MCLAGRDREREGAYLPMKESERTVGSKRQRRQESGEQKEMRIEGGRGTHSRPQEKDGARDQAAEKESRWTASGAEGRGSRSREGRRKRVVRRRLVCGAFTGVGPSFILPLQSVNTYARSPRACVCVHTCAGAYARVCCVIASLYAYLLTGALFADNDEGVPRRGR